MKNENYGKLVSFLAPIFRVYLSFRECDPISWQLEQILQSDFTIRIQSLYSLRFWKLIPPNYKGPIEGVGESEGEQERDSEKW